MVIYTATWAEDNQGETLTELGISNRLLSFYFLKELPEDWFKNYSSNGQIQNKEELPRNFTPEDVKPKVNSNKRLRKFK